VRRRAAVTIVVLSLLVAGTACGRGKDGPAGGLVLDGSPRVPDVEGVVRAVDRSHLELDGSRRYPIGDQLQSFNSRTMNAMSVLQRKGEYVQVGLEDGVAVWVAAIGAVVPLERPTVFYQGKVDGTRNGRVVFEDGTTLRLASGVKATKGLLVRAELDPKTRRVEALVPL
jgi:hypothetical protein